MTSIAIHERSRTVVIGHVRAKATWLRRTDHGIGVAFPLSNGITVLAVKADASDDHLILELWAGTPGESNGVALHGESEEPVSWSQIPLCSCGVRGCGNVNRQYSEELDADKGAELLAALPALPGGRTIQTDAPIWPQSAWEKPDPSAGWTAYAPPSGAAFSPATTSPSAVLSALQLQ